jgi:general secretion pathway protein H
LNRISFHEPINKTAGFTLIELLIVIVIVAIMSAVVGSNIGSGNQSTVLNGAAREVASALRYARGHAMTHRKESAFQFDLEQNSYRVTGKSKEYKVSKDIEVTLELAQSQVQDDSQGAIRFFPDGSSTGGRVTLEIAESKRQLDVNWLTGQVEISEF